MGWPICRFIYFILGGRCLGCPKQVFPPPVPARPHRPTGTFRIEGRAPGNVLDRGFGPWIKRRDAGAEQG